MFRETIIRQLFIGLFFSFLAAAGLQADLLDWTDEPNQTWELMAESESTLYSAAQAEQTLELQVHGAGILLLESSAAAWSHNGPTLAGALQSPGGAHWIRQQGTHLSLAFTRPGIHRLRIVQGGLPEELEGVFVPTEVRSRQLQLPTARGYLDVDRVELLDPMDGSLWMGVLEARGTQGGTHPVSIGLSWTSERRSVQCAQGSLTDTTMVVTLQQTGVCLTPKNGQGNDPNPPDDEVDPYPSGSLSCLGMKNGQGNDPNPPDDEVDPYPSGSLTYLGMKNGQGNDPNPPDDEVDPYPSGSLTYLGTRNGQGNDPNPPDDEVDPYPSGSLTCLGMKNGQGNDPNPPDDEVDPYPSGSLTYLGTRNGQGNDPNPPDDEVDPYPSGLSATATAGVLAHQLRLQVRSAGQADGDDEALAALAWLSHLLMPELGAQSPVDVEVRGLVH